MPDESTLQGLLALMLLTDARRATRTDEDGRLLRHACRGALLDRLERRDEAADAYRAALACEPSPEESAFLRERLTTGR